MKKKLAVGFTLVFLLMIGFVVWVFSAANTQRSEIYIKTGDNADSLYANIIKTDAVQIRFAFDMAWRFMDIKKVYPGKYVIVNKMSNREVINMFKYGRQKDVDFRFGNSVLPHELYAALGRKFEADSADFEKAINNKVQLDALGLDSNSVLALFWADTYRFPWAISPAKMVRRFVNEQQIYWDADKFNKLVNTGLKSAREVYILASIIEKEAMKDAELPIMAGVYLNRLRIGMPLQADPTLKYAAGIKSMRRVTGIMDTISPYNTYKNAGLPPGPIGIVSKTGVEAVLNFQTHDYLYFCAKEDFSNTHYFTKSYAEHKLNAKKYRAALDSRGIR